MAEFGEQIKGPGEEDVPVERKAAIALRYDVDRDKAPLILATGRGAVAGNRHPQRRPQPIGKLDARREALRGVL